MFNNPVIAHRGASAYAPENTLAAFKLAKQLGAEWVEFDVMLSQDEQAVVFHDDKINRTTDGKGRLTQMTLAEIQSLDAGSWFSSNFTVEPIPTLSQVLECCGKLGLRANIEIKPEPGRVEVTTVGVMTAINQFWSLQAAEPIVSSFEVKALELARSIDPEIKLGLLMDKWDKDWLRVAENLAVTSVHCNHRLLNAKRVAQIKQAGFYCLAYTVNKVKLGKRLLAYGVDGIFSDYPDLFA